MAKANHSRNNLITVELNLKEGFCGTAVVNFDKGVPKYCLPLRKNEFFGSLDDFLCIARKAGYQVIPPATQG